MDLTLAVLSWRQPKTLRNTLESYRQNGLLELAAEKLVFLNEATSEDMKIAQEFGFEVLSSAKNIGIGLPFQQLVARATRKYFLFLENDFMLVENAEVTKKRMEAAVNLLDKGISAVRLRHLHHYGDPNMYLKMVWNGKLSPEEPSLEGAYYWPDICQVYGEKAEKLDLDGENYFVMDSRYSGYSNNPTIYQSAFLKEFILPLKFNTTDVVENKVGDDWARRRLKVARGIGLFKHHPIELSGSAFSNYKRVKSPVKTWWHYIFRIGLRGRVFNLFLLQFLPMIFKVNINFANKFMINLSLGRYESV